MSDGIGRNRIVPSTAVVPEIAERLVVQRVGVFSFQHRLTGQPFLRDVHHE